MMTEYNYGPASKADDQDEVATPTGVAPKAERIEGLGRSGLAASVAAAVNGEPEPRARLVEIVARNHASAHVRSVEERMEAAAAAFNSIGYEAETWPTYLRVRLDLSVGEAERLLELLEAKR
jgi:hypothetical protein